MRLRREWLASEEGRWWWRQRLICVDCEKQEQDKTNTRLPKRHIYVLFPSFVLLQGAFSAKKSWNGSWEGEVVSRYWKDSIMEREGGVTMRFPYFLGPLFSLAQHTHTHTHYLLVGTLPDTIILLFIFFSRSSPLLKPFTASTQSGKNHVYTYHVFFHHMLLEYHYHHHHLHWERLAYWG